MTEMISLIKIIRTIVGAAMPDGYSMSHNHKAFKQILKRMSNDPDQNVTFRVFRIEIRDNITKRRPGDAHQIVAHINVYRDAVVLCSLDVSFLRNRNPDLTRVFNLAEPKSLEHITQWIKNLPQKLANLTPSPWR